MFWQLTRVERSEEAPAPKRTRNSEFWQGALRRGFEAAAGEQPGKPREVDPTRERIIESTLELHKSRGIQATTWPEIADKAGVPEETVKALFPTQDGLVRSCGEHFMESLQLPPADRVPEVFAGASSENERIRRLVETFFGVYERGGGRHRLGAASARMCPRWMSRWKSSTTRWTPSSSRRYAHYARTAPRSRP